MVHSMVHTQNNSPMSEQKNPLICNPDSGICELPDTANAVDATMDKSTVKPLKLIYYTDPICSSCWGIEPQLRKLKLEYGNCLDIEYRMGGLLPDWSYNSGGISKPSDVAHHWDEVSKYYDMPIDGDVWIEDPLHSSYPPSVAFKAVQMQDPQKAILFLREIREMVFLQKKNITKWEHLVLAAKNVGIDTALFKQDYEGQALVLFNQDLLEGKQLAVRGFPTIFFTDANGHTEKVYGSQPYSVYENTLLKLYPTATKVNYDKTWMAVFLKYPTLTAKEFSELTGTERIASENILNDLVAKGQLTKSTTKNGDIWKLLK
jgi:putative protein-disulfide isomerase